MKESKRMNIAIDISQIAYAGTGVGRFVDGLTRAILAYEKEHSWTFFYSSLRQEFSPPLRQLIGESGHRLVEYRLPPTALSFLWNTIHRMKIEKLTGNADWVITSDWTEPPSRMRKATVIHDLAYLRFPETVHPLIRKTQAERMRWVKKETKVVFADSQSTKDDIVELLHIPPRAVHVNYPGVETVIAGKELLAAVKKKHGLTRPFILTVGKIEPRKNIGRLISAFRKMNRDDLDLVIVGMQGWDTETSERQSGDRNIRFLGYVSEEDLAALYGSCLLFVYPSLYEGFGYPVVEAMRSGAPVATSRSSSLKELGQDAAALFDPENEGDIADTITRLLRDESERANRAKKGIMRSQEYAWDRYIKSMMSVLQTAYHSDL